MRNTTTNHCGALVTDEMSSLAVDNGRAFYIYNESDDLDTGASLDTLFITGSRPVSVIFNLEVFGGQVLAYIYEDTVTSSDGVEIPAQRFNRINTRIPLAKGYESPVITNVGTEFVKRRVLAYAQGNYAISSTIGAGYKRVLKPNTKYLLRQTAMSDNIALTLLCTFCEA